MTSMTLKAARIALRAAGVSIKNTGYGDFRVSLPGGSEDAAYYSNDLQDCVDTGLDMARRAQSAGAGRDPNDNRAEHDAYMAEMVRKMEREGGAK